jgi:hypothetical protein
MASSPGAAGGSASLENAQLACRWCNQSKGAGTVPENPPPDYVGPLAPSVVPKIGALVSSQQDSIVHAAPVWGERADFIKSASISKRRVSQLGLSNCLVAIDARRDDRAQAVANLLAAWEAEDALTYKHPTGQSQGP